MFLFSTDQMFFARGLLCGLWRWWYWYICCAVVLFVAVTYMMENISDLFISHATRTSGKTRGRQGPPSRQAPLIHPTPPSPPLPTRPLFACRDPPMRLPRSLRGAEAMRGPLC